MAYRAQDLSALAYANGFTLWHYRTSDAPAEIDNSGYFNGASRMVRVGDFIMLSAGISGVPSHGIVIVATNANGNVDVTNLTAFGAFNTD